MASRIDNIEWYKNHLIEWRNSNRFAAFANRFLFIGWQISTDQQVMLRLKFKLKGAELFIAVENEKKERTPIAKLYFLSDDTSLMCDSFVQGKRNRTFEPTTRTAALKEHLTNLAMKALDLI